MHYRWPKFSLIYGKFSNRRTFKDRIYFLRQFIRFAIRNFFAKKQIDIFVKFINQDSRRINLFDCFGQEHRIVCKDFLNRQFSADERLQAIRSNLLAMEIFFSKPCYEVLLKGKQLELFSLDWGLQCVLKINGTFEEGFLALELYYKEMRIYHCSLAFLKDGEEYVLLIPCMQGIGNGEEIKTLIHEITKKSFGLRPRAILLEATRMLKDNLGLSKLFAVQSVQQIRYQKIKKKNYFADYDQMWKDFGSEVRGKYFDLSTSKHKDLSEIPSQKRSMYRKRFDLLENIKQMIQERCAEIGVKRCL